MNSGITELSPYEPGKPIEDLERELGLKDINFIDNVHVDQISKAVIAKRMSKDVEQVYINNCNQNE